MTKKFLPAVVVAIAIALILSASIAAPVTDADRAPIDLRRTTLVVELNQLLEDLYQT